MHNLAQWQHARRRWRPASGAAQRSPDRDLLIRMATRDQRGRFTRGQSGNPAGRPSGISNAALLRRAIEGHLPKILKTLIAAAEQGDVPAARLLMDRALPPLKAIDLPAPVGLPDGDLSAQARAVLRAVAEQRCTPDEAQRLVAAMAAAAKVVEITEIEQRVAALEASYGGPE